MLERSPQSSWIDGYADTLGAAVKGAEATDGRGKSMTVDEALQWAAETARRTHDAGNKLIFAGNGGSAAICSRKSVV